MINQSYMVCVLLVAAMVMVGSARGPDRERLNFKVSARGLAENYVLTTSPYVKISYTENESETETKIGKSETLTGTSPDWPEIFTFDFVRDKKQKWHFEVKSRELIVKESKGDAYVNVSDYVDKNQYLEVDLSKQGYLIIQKA